MVGIESQADTREIDEAERVPKVYGGDDLEHRVRLRDRGRPSVCRPRVLGAKDEGVVARELAGPRMQVALHPDLIGAHPLIVWEERTVNAAGIAHEDVERASVELDPKEGREERVLAEPCAREALATPDEPLEDDRSHRVTLSEAAV